MFLPKSSFDQLLTETNCFFVGQRNLTCCWFVSSTQNYIERQFEISFAWSLWAILDPKPDVDIKLNPILIMVLPKSLKILLAWGLEAISFLSISISCQHGKIVSQHTQKCVAVANRDRTEIWNFIGIRPLGNFSAPNRMQTLSKTPPWWYFYQKVNFIHCYLKKLFLRTEKFDMFLVC